jgi:hypothetical protein
MNGPRAEQSPRAAEKFPRVVLIEASTGVVDYVLPTEQIAPEFVQLMTQAA